MDKIPIKNNMDGHRRGTAPGAQHGPAGRPTLFDLMFNLQEFGQVRMP
jgi:hypothetical protein